ncbi:MAG: xanthine dehydrogenase family protein subunit M [Deltaproteobacteria bacterium]|nr:xanthine dehydrogenase family protein subunit M [Deltaproteobacteria bacterium]
MTLPKFEYFAPQSLDEAQQLLLDHGEGAHLLAGGTDLLVKMNHGLLKPASVIALKHIKGLETIKYDPKEGLKIGATALLADVAAHPDIRKHYPAVAAGAHETANVQIRNMGTVAGNLCNAAPSADNAPTLLAMNAEVEISGASGERRVPLDQFFKGPGQNVLASGEILTAIHVPLTGSGEGVSYQHISARGKVDISAVCVGVMVRMAENSCSDVRIFLGAVAPVPMRAVKAEAVVRGKELTGEIIEAAGIAAMEESQPITDVRSSADYRKKMVAVLTRRALMEARDRALKS